MKKTPIHLPWHLGLAVNRSGSLHLFALLIVLLNFIPLAHAQNVIWDKTIGGSKRDDLTTMQQTRDGGYLLGGWSFSDKSGDKTAANKGEADFWVVKLNANRSKVWDKTFGGDANDQLTALQQTQDGGYILGGYSNSGKNGDKSEASKGNADYWIIKLNADGSKAWDKTFGGDGEDNLVALQQTADGGYILGGSSYSDKSGDKTEPSRGYVDFWIIKLNASGNKVWDKTMGGSTMDLLRFIWQTKDGHYILGGLSESEISGDKSAAKKGVTDYWFIKLNAEGTKVWDKTYGGSSTEFFEAAQQTTDGGYILAGTSDSDVSGDKSEPSRGSTDYWVVKVDANGSKEWDKTIGGNQSDDLNAVVQTPDGGYVLGGSSNSGIGDEKSEVNYGDEYTYDYWLVKLTADGKFFSDKVVGGRGNESLTTLHQTPAGNFLLGGSSDSDKSSDKSENNKGEGDFWIVQVDSTFKKSQFISFEPIYNQVVGSPAISLQAKASSNLPVSYEVLSGPATVKDNKLTVFAAGPVRVAAYQKGNNTYKPNEKIQSFIATLSGKQNEWTYGGSQADTLTTMIPTSDGGYLLGGTSYSGQSGDKSQASQGSSDYWVAKISKTGQKQWDKTLGGRQADKLSAMVATADGGYLLGGTSTSGKTGDKSQANKGKSDFWLVKIDSAGNKLWDKTYGGTGMDNLAAILITKQGYLLGGSSNSGVSGDKSQASKGKTDYWIVEIDVTGNKLWDQTYGGNQDDQLAALLASPEGGFLVGGSSASGTSSDKSQPTRALVDYWVIRIDERGTKLWDKTYGGIFVWSYGDIDLYKSGYSYLRTLITTPDGNYLLGGSSSAAKGAEKSEENVSTEHASYWLIKINLQGEKIWDNSYSGILTYMDVDFGHETGNSQLSAVVPLPEGGYLLAGTSDSFKGRDKSEENRRASASPGSDHPRDFKKIYALWNDYWIIKIDEQGNKLEDRTLGSDKNDKLVAAAQTPEGNFLLAGYSESDKNNDKTGPSKGGTDYWILQVTSRKVKEPEVTAWDAIFSGYLQKDYLTDVIKTTDGGYLAGGYANSRFGAKTGSDYWIVKINKRGQKQWDKYYRGNKHDYLNRVIQTQDGGYLLAGSSLSNKDPYKTQDSRGDRDYWVIKVDADGKKQWDKTFGGSGYDELQKVIQLKTGEYVLGGSSNSPTSGDKTQGSQGGTDYWVVKISSTGTKLWDKHYGGTNSEELSSFTLTPDEGLLLVGSSQSGKNGDKTQASQGGTDYWIVKTDQYGNLLWDKTYGGNGHDQAYSVATSGKGFFIAGTSSSGKSGSKTQASQGGKDYWLIKIDAQGNQLWDKTLGGSQDDELSASSASPDGGLVLAGSSYSNISGNKSQSSRGSSDYWIVKVDAAGNLEYDQRFGSNGADELRAVLHTNDGGLLLGGRSDANASGERSQNGLGYKDYWLVKVAPLTSMMVVEHQANLVEESVVKLSNLTAYPNPFQNKISIRFTLPETQTATLRILDSQGKEVATLFQQEAQAKQPYEVEWQADKQEAGLYLLQLQTPTGQNTQKLLLSK